MLRWAWEVTVAHVSRDCTYFLPQGREVGGVSPAVGVRRLRPREVPQLAKVTQPQAAQLHGHLLCLWSATAVCATAPAFILILHLDKEA